ncbi:MAG TPA: transcription antitermination factor NusB [Acidimicrobiales bacterium]|nr:transcription antitermination factor NusB [Acidimicrobiales bacterium]
MSELGRHRHQARERALELSYEASAKSRSLSEILVEQSVAPDAYTVTILESAEQHRERIDEIIERNSLEWTLDRLAIIDRLVMTLALAELMLDDPPPTAVVLDEAVELAKIYSTEGSASFVNGVLSACVNDLR